MVTHPAEAKWNIHRSDKARGAYYRHISGKRWGDGKNYQLVLDSSVGIDKTVEMIVNCVDKHTSDKM
ncbi:MAG: cytidylate kinase family protein [Blautia sp.]